MQDVAWTSSLILMAIVAIVFLWVVAGAHLSSGDARVGPGLSAQQADLRGQRHLDPRR